MVSRKTPRRWAGRRGRRSVALAARPDQAVLAGLALDHAGIDGRRERRVIQRHRQIRPVRLADLLPRRADLVVAAGLDAVVRSVLAFLVVGDELDLDVERQGANRAGEAVALRGEGADVSHDEVLSRFARSRPSRPWRDP